MTTRTRTLLPLLMLIITVSYLTSGVYIPAIPTIEHYFNTNPEFAKLTQASYLLGLGFSQLLYGPLSDAYGRRVPLLIGLIFLFAGSIFCASAHSIHQLIIARATQGIGAGAGLSLTRAILRDHFIGKNLARMASYFTINAFIFASSAPLLGSVILHYSSWRWVFIFLTLASIVTFMACLWAVPETNKHIDATLIYPKTLAANTLQLFRDRVFLIYSTTIFCAFGSLMGWFTISSMVIQKHYGYTPIQYGLIIFGMGVINIIGGMVNAKLTTRTALPALVQFGLMVGVLCAMILITANLLNFTPLWIILAALTIFTFGFTFIFANAFALAFSQFERKAGLASAGFSFMQTIGGFVGSALMSFSRDDTTLPFALLMLTFSALAIIAVRLTPTELTSP